MFPAHSKILRSLPAILIVVGLSGIPAATMLLRSLAGHPWLEAAVLGVSIAFVGGMLFTGVSSWIQMSWEERRSRQLLALCQPNPDRLTLDPAAGVTGLRESSLTIWAPSGR
jgi:hypothetical protein